MERKPLPIGIEDFKEVIDSGYYFVDKTLMIKDLRQYRIISTYKQNHPAKC